MNDTMSGEEKVALYEKLIPSHPDAVRKGDTILYTSDWCSNIFQASFDYVSSLKPKPISKRSK